MEYFLYCVVGLLLLTVIGCGAVKQRLRRRLDDIDGFVGITKHSDEGGTLVGGVIRKRPD